MTIFNLGVSPVSRGFSGIVAALAFLAVAALPAAAQSGDRQDTYQEDEIVREAGNFFGGVSQGLADAVHSVFQRYGEPNAYIKGEEASGAFVVGLRYGQGELVMKNGTTRTVYWQGPSAGWDFGGNAVKVFTLVYELPNGDAIYQRFPGVEGSAYLIGGIGVNYQQRDNVILAPMRAGVGVRLGASVGYLKYTKSREWLPF
ncbi:MAG: DUF1134 domain-containing protein [Parvibaculum sp.]|jgi:hypothetical protein|nr:DUF1134 domain-containing protein [Parvibaculum sp.]